MNSWGRFDGTMLHAKQLFTELEQDLNVYKGMVKESNKTINIWANRYQECMQDRDHWQRQLHNLQCDYNRLEEVYKDMIDELQCLKE